MEFLSEHIVYSVLVLHIVAVCSIGGFSSGRSDSLNAIEKHLIEKRHTALDNSKLCKVIGCVNGYCKESELLKFRIVCKCYTGYEGTLCERLKCPYPCGPHGTCSRKGQGVYCKCKPGYGGKTCDNLSSKAHSHTLHKLLKPVGSETAVTTFGELVTGSKPTLFSLSSGSTAWFRHKSPEVKFADFISHAIVDTGVKPDICAPGFKCYHGTCDRKAMAYGLFQCQCKPNYTGLFCEKRCTLTCKNGGTCMVLDDGHQFCACPFNTTGIFCQKQLLLT